MVEASTGRSRCEWIMLRIVGRVRGVTPRLTHFFSPIRDIFMKHTFHHRPSTLKHIHSCHGHTTIPFARLCGPTSCRNEPSALEYAECITRSPRLEKLPPESGVPHNVIEYPARTAHHHYLFNPAIPLVPQLIALTFQRGEPLRGQRQVILVVQIAVGLHVTNHQTCENEVLCQGMLKCSGACTKPDRPYPEGCSRGGRRGRAPVA
jgi:hypothetical protein